MGYYKSTKGYMMMRCDIINQQCPIHDDEMRYNKSTMPHIINQQWDIINQQGATYRDDMLI